MAKVGFSKLGLKKKDIINTITIGENIIEVSQYISVQDKLQLITNVLNSTVDQNNFLNPIKLDLFGTLEIIAMYTNITFTDKQREDPVKLYDLLTENNIVDMVFEAIPDKELDFIWNGIEECAVAIYEYNNSIMGILDNVQRNYSNLNLNTDEITAKLSNPENLTLVKDIVTKLG